MDTKKIVISSLLLAIGLVLNYFMQFYLPIGGESTVRISPSGPFIIFVGILFGPILGGIIPALSDIIGFLLMNRSTSGYIWPLTIVAFCKGACIAFLWHRIKTINFKIVTIAYISIFAILLLLGSVNQIFLSLFPDSQYTAFLLNSARATPFFSIALILVGIGGLLLYFIALKVLKKEGAFSLYLRLISCLLLPSLFFTTINTWILIEFISSLQSAFVYIWIPRFVEEVFTVLFNVYIIMILIDIYKRMFNVDLTKNDATLP